VHSEQQLWFLASYHAVSETEEPVVAGYGGGEEGGNGRVVVGALFGTGEVEDGRMRKEVVRTIVRFCPEEDVSLK